MSSSAPKPDPGRFSLKTAARLAAVQALYVIDVTGANPELMLHDFLAHNMPKEAEKTPHLEFDHELFSLIVRQTLACQEKIDALLATALDAKYKLERMEKILKAIFRAGASELVSIRVDHAIIINDYVGITHGFFAGKEPGLVNAVLDKIAKTMQI